jgi:hypothetical protein
VDGDNRRIGDAARGQRGTRVWVARRVAWRWVVGRPMGHHRDRAILGAVLGAILGRILGGILETVCLWLSLCLPPCRHRALHPALCATLSAGRRPAPATSLLVLLQPSPGVLPLCPAVPRGMAGRRPYATISPRLEVPTLIILRGDPPSRNVTGRIDTPTIGR